MFKLLIINKLKPIIMNNRIILTLAVLFTNFFLIAQNATCIYTPYFKTFVPPLTASPGGNTVLNNDFESGNIVNWNLLPNANRVKIVNNGYNSNYSVKLISKNNAGGDAYINQTIVNLIPGNTYNLSAFMKSNWATNTNKVTANLNIRFNYPSGNYNTITLLCRPTTNWNNFTNTFTVPMTANLQQCIVQVLIYRGQNDSVQVDNIQLITPSSNFGVMNAPTPVPPIDIFFEDFKGISGNSLSTTKWLVVKKAWGNNSTANNNGVVPENLELLCDGGMRFHGHGDLYNGPINGVGGALGNGKIRVGSCIATKDYYASGFYEVEAKLTTGMVNAFWTFHYIEDAAYQNGGIKNTEIDWEFPSNNINGIKTIINDGLCNTWGGLCSGEGFHSTTSVNNLGADLTQDFHKYQIEWHSGGNGITPSVKWYIDSVLVKTETNPSHVPFRASRFWLGVWFGNNNWINGGNTSIMQYEDKYMEVKSIKITPFYEVNDVYENETDPAIGYAGPSLYPVFPCTAPQAMQRMLNPENEIVNVNYSNKNVNDLIQLFPNPANELVNINYETNEDDALRSIVITDLIGAIILQKQFDGNENKSVQISLNNAVSQGYYFIKGITMNGNTFNKKLMIKNN